VGLAYLPVPVLWKDISSIPTDKKLEIEHRNNPEISPTQIPHFTLLHWYNPREGLGTNEAVCRHGWKNNVPVNNNARSMVLFQVTVVRNSCIWQNTCLKLLAAEQARQVCFCLVFFVGSTLLLGRAFLVWWMETQTMGGNHSSYVYTGLLCYWAERS